MELSGYIAASDSLRKKRKQIKLEQEQIAKETKYFQTKIKELVYFNVNDLLKVMADLISRTEDKKVKACTVGTEYSDRPGGDGGHPYVDYWRYWWFFANEEDEQECKNLFARSCGYYPKNAPKSLIVFFHHDIEQGKGTTVRSKHEALSNIPDIGVYFSHIRRKLDGLSDEDSTLFDRNKSVIYDWFERYHFEYLRDFIDYLLEKQFEVEHRLSYDEMKALLDSYLNDHKNKVLAKSEKNK